MTILRRAHALFDQIVGECAPRPRQVTVTVAVDPVWHGHDLTAADAQDIVHAAINARSGLEVIPTNDRPAAGTGEAQ